MRKPALLQPQEKQTFSKILFPEYEIEVDNEADLIKERIKSIEEKAKDMISFANDACKISFVLSSYSYDLLLLLLLLLLILLIVR